MCPGGCGDSSRDMMRSLGACQAKSAIYINKCRVLAWTMVGTMCVPAFGVVDVADTSCMKASDTQEEPFLLEPSLGQRSCSCRHGVCTPSYALAADI
jgi:hypothetical protein